MKVVAVGGGHGTAVSLRALRRVSDDVTGVVSVADDGGSTGRLRALLNVAAVGDLRLGALADPDNPLTACFEHRFNVGARRTRRHGVVPDVVLDQFSEYASQRCSFPVHIANLSGRNGMVHDVQKLTEAVFAEVR